MSKKTNKFLTLMLVSSMVFCGTASNNYLVRAEEKKDIVKTEKVKGTKNESLENSERKKRCISISGGYAWR